MLHFFLLIILAFFTCLKKNLKKKLFMMMLISSKINGSEKPTIIQQIDKRLSNNRIMSSSNRKIISAQDKVWIIMKNKTSSQQSKFKGLKQLYNIRLDLFQNKFTISQKKQSNLFQIICFQTIQNYRYKHLILIFTFSTFLNQFTHFSDSKLFLETHLQMQKYKIIKTMGDGSFGVVFKAVTPKNQVVAIKKFKQKYASWDECLQLREIKSLKKIDHPNLIKLKQVILANNQLYLVFDFIETNLYQVYVRANESKRTLTEGEIKSIFYKIASGLAYFHKNGFFHRDLKPENILCHNNEVKICDFGLARQIRSKPPFTEYVSTRWYRAPQLLLHSGTYNFPVDIFALACIIIELYTLTPLFPGSNEVETMNKVVELLGTPKKDEWPEGYKLASKINYNFPQKKKKELYDIMPHADPQIIQLLQSMLSYNAKKRPTAAQILKHQYFQSLNKQSDPAYDPKNETKFSFYEKQTILEIPKNLKVENPKQMQMRRSLIKFGNSFTSSFHLEKKADEIINGSSKKLLNSDRQKQNLEIKKQTIAKKQTISSNKKIGFHTPEDEIAKKFDEMEEILMELQQKEKSAKKQQKKEKRKSDETFMSPLAFEDKYEMSAPAGGFVKKDNSSSNFSKTSEEVKLQGFIFGGLNNIASNNNLKNLVKFPQK